MEQQPNNKEHEGPKQPAQRCARLHLPFENKKKDPVELIFDYRFGICVTLIVALSLSVVFVWAKVGNPNKPVEPVEQETLYIDLSDMEILEQKLPAPQVPEQELQPSREDWRSVQNLTSNENAAEGEELRNNKFADDAELKRLQEAAAQGAQENKAAREKGLREVAAIQNPIRDQDREEADNSKNHELNANVKRKGAVVVSFSFKNPVRNSVYLVKPAYRCEGGGEVVVEAVLNQDGKVISAVVVRGGDECMRLTAKQAALGSVFNIDSTAPAKQKGTITYIFIPQ
jgi:hypothetical protein